MHFNGLFDGATNRFLVGSVDTDRTRSSWPSVELGGNGLRRGEIEVGDHHVCSLGATCLGRSTAQPRRPANDQRHPLVQPYYRCKFPAEYAVTEQQHAKTVYVKEASIVPVVDESLAGLFTDDQIDSTCAALESTFGPDPPKQHSSSPPAASSKNATPSSPVTARRSRPAPTPRSSRGGSRR